jgi:hypothetical protein
MRGVNNIKWHFFKNSKKSICQNYNENDPCGLPVPIG